MKKQFSYMNRVQANANNIRNSRYSNFTGDMSGTGANYGQNRLSNFSRTLTVKIVNATTAAAAYVVFGYNVYGDAANAGCDTGVTVTVTQSSGSRASRALANSPMMLSMCKYQTTNASNFANDITKYYKPMTGNGAYWPASPLTYFDSFQQQSLLITIPDFDGLVFGGDDYLTGNIDAGTTITLILTLKSIVGLSDALTDQSVISATNAAPSGSIRPLLMQMTSAAPTMANTAPSKVSGSASGTTIQPARTITVGTK